MNQPDPLALFLGDQGDATAKQQAAGHRGQPEAGSGPHAAVLARSMIRVVLPALQPDSFQRPVSASTTDLDRLGRHDQHAAPGPELPLLCLSSTHEDAVVQEGCRCNLAMVPKIRMACFRIVCLVMSTES